SERHVETRAGTAHLLARGHDRLGPAQDLAHAVAAGRVPERAVLEFAGAADDGALAIGLDVLRRDAERGDQAPGHVDAEGLQLLHQGHGVGNVAAGMGIVDDGRAGALLERPRRRRPALMQDPLAPRRELAPLEKRHAAPPPAPAGADDVSYRIIAGT